MSREGVDRELGETRTLRCLAIRNLKWGGCHNRLILNYYWLPSMAIGTAARGGRGGSGDPHTGPRPERRLAAAPNGSEAQSSAVAVVVAGLKFCG